MTKVCNPADKLDLPELPDDQYWSVFRGPFGMTMIGLYQRRKYWIDRKIEDTFPTEFYDDDTRCPLDVGLEHGAERILARIKRRNNYSAETRKVFDTKIYWEDLVETTKAQ